MDVRTMLQPAMLSFVWFLSSVLILDPSAALQVTIQNRFNVAMLSQPVTFRCNYQTTATQLLMVIWRYKSYCRIQESPTNNQLQQNPSYNPSVECPDNTRTIRVVASKHGNTVTLGEFYQGRRIAITNAADLSIQQTAREDTGVYYCNVYFPEDLQGNNEAYAELIVLG